MFSNVNVSIENAALEHIYREISNVATIRFCLAKQFLFRLALNSQEFPSNNRC